MISHFKSPFVILFLSVFAYYSNPDLIKTVQDYDGDIIVEGFLIYNNPDLVE
jgi:hypothetical protein